MVSCGKAEGNWGGGGRRGYIAHVGFEGETATEKLCEEAVEVHVVRGNYVRRL
jgi:hypothetical protein